MLNVLFFGMILIDQLRRAAGEPSRLPRPADRTLWASLVLPLDYGALCLVFLRFVAPSVFYPVYGISAPER